jgi:hypothetical protein
VCAEEEDRYESEGEDEEDKEAATCASRNHDYVC